VGRGRRLIAVVALLLARSFPAMAHPHAWITLHSAVVFDARGRIASLEEEWLFDEDYTAFNVESLKPDQRASKTALTQLIGQDLARIQHLGYFTAVRADGKPVPFGTVSTYESEMRGKQLWLRFVLPLAAPIDPRAARVTYWIADPTYWIEMLHARGQSIALKGDAATGCAAKIAEPHPTPEMIAKAASLDIDGTVDPSLGENFAEKVTIDCRKP
jgi:ABC-type uncharacterized transport system substrate-binding protein